MRRAALALVFFGACGNDTPPLPPACEAPVQGTAITFRQVPNTRASYLLVTSPPNDARRFAIDQNGRIRQFDETGVIGPVFLDISGGNIAAGGELGLLGLAFHPSYASNGLFYIFYTTSTANIVSRFKVSATDPNVADPTETIVLSIPDFAGNHNGGMIEFGADGYLYIGTGDGGGGGDPMDNGQNPNALLGKILRIDVDSKSAGKEYGIPPGNAFPGGTGGAPEVLIYGVRNPWRWSFDRGTGDIYIGDVGQNEIEELTMIPVGTQSAKNLGWNMYEGEKCYQAPCDSTNIVMPQFTKTHGDAWCSVIGGQVYRGTCYPDIVGTYFFTDYCAHQLNAAKKTSGSTLEFSVPNASFIDANGSHTGMPAAPSSLHADSRGELWLTADGGIYRLEAGP